VTERAAVAGGDRVRVGLLAYGLDRPPAGIGRYTIELIRALHAHQPDVEVWLLKPFANPIAGLSADEKELRLPGMRLLPILMTAGPAAIAALAVRHRLDVIHDPAGVSPFLIPRRVAPFARVVTIHDVIPFVHPETHAALTNLLFRHYIPRTLRFVDRIVTVSDASKRDIERFFRVDGSRIARIHCGVGPQFAPQEPRVVANALDRYGISRPYILTVGALQARKNLETLFRAFARLREAGLPHRLVVVGRKVWKSEGAFLRLDELGLGGSVILTGYVQDADLPALYAGADCFVFPSIYEGFGLPPLEAMACGTPVVASNASSLPEVVADAGILVDPYDVDELAAAVRRVVQSPALAQELARKGLARARRFDWQLAAADHAALYRAVAASNRGRRGD
jgi:glycosyltransferase involved in cell wall biosynthesis